MASIVSLGIRYEQDVVRARQYARHIAQLLGFDAQQQTRLATAVSEFARNAFQHGGGGRVEFELEGDSAPQILLVRVRDSGPGIPELKRILDESYSSRTGMGLGIVGARRLMDRFEIHSEAGRGTTIEMRKLLPRHVRFLADEALREISAQLSRREPQNLLEELRQQNTELVRTLEELRQRQEELAQLNRELGRHQPRGGRAVRGTGRAERPPAPRRRGEDALPFEHDARISNAAELDPGAHAAAAGTRGRRFDAGAGAAGALHPEGVGVAIRTGERPAGPGQSGRGENRDPARRVRSERPVRGAARDAPPIVVEHRGEPGFRRALRCAAA